MDENQPINIPGAPSPTPAPAMPGAIPALPAGGDPPPSPPEGAPAAAAPPPPPPPTAMEPVEIPDDVPYPRFREVQRERTQFQREADGLRTERDTLKGRLEALEQARQKEAQEVEDFRAIREAILGDPELYQIVEQRIMQAAGRGGAPGAPPGRPGQPPVATLPPELQEKLDRVIQATEQREQREQEFRKQEALRADLARLETTVTQLLDRAKVFKPEAYPDVKRAAMRYIVQSAMADGGGGFEDVPYHFNRWMRETFNVMKAQQAAAVAGHQTDQRLVPPAIGPGATVAAVETIPALGTPEFEQYVARKSREAQGAAGALG